MSVNVIHMRGGVFYADKAPDPLAHLAEFLEADKDPASSPKPMSPETRKAIDAFLEVEHALGVDLDKG